MRDVRRKKSGVDQQLSNLILSRVRKIRRLENYWDWSQSIRRSRLYGSLDMLNVKMMIQTGSSDVCRRRLRELDREYVQGRLGAIVSRLIQGVLACPERAKLHYTDTGYEHRLWTPAIRTPPTDKLTTNVQHICHIAMPGPNISTCQDVGTWQIFVRWWCS